jgi:hypothetical protein
MMTQNDGDYGDDGAAENREITGNAAPSFR